MTPERNNAMHSLASDPQTARQMLKSLRWDVDMVIENCDGERVWLGPCLDAAGKRIGITDCCLESDPCEHHAAIAARRE